MKLKEYVMRDERNARKILVNADSGGRVV